MTRLSRRSLLAATALPSVARAQGFARPIRIIVPFAAGGVADLTARAVGQRIAPLLGQPVVADNRPGAGGIVAGQQLMAAPADGHTLMVASNGTAISRALFRNLPFDPLRDFTPVVTMGAFPIAVVVAPASPIRDIAELVARMRAQPGRLNIGTISRGSTQNLSAELFKIRTGTTAETVVFPATPQLVTATLRGDVDAAFEITGPIMGQISADAIRVLAVTSAERAPNLPTRGSRRMTPLSPTRPAGHRATRPTSRAPPRGDGRPEHAARHPAGGGGALSRLQCRVNCPPA